MHNYYLEPGGEDVSFRVEADLLEARGHRVVRYTRNNKELDGRNAASLAALTFWNQGAYKDISELVARHRIDIAYFQNTFPLISPAGYHAAKAAGAAVVQVLRNYRLICANATLLRRGRVCEACVGKTVPWPAVRYSCYRGSRSASTVVASMQVAHRLLRTWTKTIDVFVALTEFAKGKFVQGGIPPGRIVVRPNFVFPDPGNGPGTGRYALFVGRLSEEKGVACLLEAWRRLKRPIPLKVVGDGPLATAVQAAQRERPEISWLGRKRPEEVAVLLGEAHALVFPSIWYEGMPRVVIESFAHGTPVIASQIGAMVSMIRHGSNGLHVPPGDPAALATAITTVFDDLEQWSGMRVGARRTFETDYTATRNYDKLVDSFRLALANAREARERGRRRDE